MQCSEVQTITSQLFFQKTLKLISVLLVLSVISEKNAGVDAFQYPTHLNSSWSEWFLDRMSLGSHLNRSHLPNWYANSVPPLAVPQKPRLPQFVTFNTLDNIMTVDLNLAFPFMRVPVSNTSNIVNLARDFMRRERPIINVDLTAITIASIMTVTATIFGLIWRTFFAPMQPRLDEKEARLDDLTDTSEMWLVLNMLNQALQNYGIDTNACVKRIVCVYVKRAVVDKRMRGSTMGHLNKILEGLTRSDWALDYIAGTDLENAVYIGRSDRNCEKVFKRCDPSSWFYLRH